MCPACEEPWGQQQETPAVARSGCLGLVGHWLTRHLRPCTPSWAPGKPSYKPTFQEVEDTVRTVLDNMVVAVTGLPRVGSNTVGSTSFTPPPPGALIPPSTSTIPTTSLQEESVVLTKKVRSKATSWV